MANTQAIVDTANLINLAESGLIQAIRLYQVISANHSGAKSLDQLVAEANAAFADVSATADAEIKANS